MNSVQLEGQLSQLDGYQGVFAVNFFPYLEIGEFCVFNTKCWPCTTEVGHWLVAYSESDCLEFFDSYGLNPGFYGFPASLDYDICFSHAQLQSLTSATCGQWCVVFCMYKKQGGSFADFSSYFSKKNHEANDIRVRSMVNV